MAKGDEITTRFRVDISDLKAGISEANQQIRLANAQFKAATDGMDDWSHSADGIKAKLENLTSILAAQKSKLEAYETQLQRQKDAYEKNGEKASELRRQLEELANSGVSKASDEYKNLEKALSNVEDEQQRNKKAGDELEVTILNQKAAVSRTEKDIRTYNDTLDDLEGESKDADKETDELSESVKDSGDAAEKAASGGFTVLKGALASLVADGIRKAIAGLKEFVDQGIEYESAFADVVKTVDGTDEQLSQLNSEIRDMAKVMPQSASEIAEVASAAGQLGIKTDDIAAFTKTMIMLGDSTNLSSEEAATALARFATVTGMSADDYSKLGSTIVDLGNNFATSEAEIVDMAARLAAAGTQVGMNQSEIMGLATALSSVGINAEAGGTAFSKLMVKMQVAAQTGDKAQDVIEDTGMTLRELQMLSDENALSFKAVAHDLGYTSTELKEFMSAAQNLEDFSNVTQMTADEFKQAFANDAIGTIQKFIAGLDGAEDSEESAIVMLTEMGLTEVRLRDAILRSVNAKDTFNTAIETGNSAWQEDTALVDEASRRYETTASKIQILKNNMTELGLEMFDKLQPYMQDLIDFLTENFEPAFDKAVEIFDDISAAVDDMLADGQAFLDWLNGGSAGAEALKTALVALLAGFTAFMAVQGIISLIDGIKTAFIALNAVMAANPVGLVVAAIAALVAAFIYLWNNCEEFRQFWIDLWENIKEIAKTVWDAISKFFVDAWDKIKAAWEKVKEFFAPAVQFFTELFTKIYTSGKAIMESVVGAFREAWELIKVVWDLVKPYFEAIWNKIKEVFSVVSEVLGQFFSDAWDTIKSVWDFVKPYFSAAWEGIKKVFSVVKETLGSYFSTAWEAIKVVWDAVTGYFQMIWDTIATVFSVVKDVLQGNFQSAWNAIKSIVDQWKGYFQGVWDGIKSIFSTVGTWFGSVFNAAKDAIKGPLNFIIDGLNALIRGINKISFDVPDWVPVIGGMTWGFNIAEIPKLARGGILARGQTGFLEGTGAEAVVPLDQNKYWIHSVVSELFAQLMQAEAATGGGGVTNIGGSRDYNFTQIINAPKSPSRIEIYRQTRNLLSFARASAGGD